MMMLGCRWGLCATVIHDSTFVWGGLTSSSSSRRCSLRFRNSSSASRCLSWVVGGAGADIADALRGAGATLAAWVSIVSSCAMGRLAWFLLGWGHGEAGG